VLAPKMDGAKYTTDTPDQRKLCGKLVYRLGRSMSERICGPYGNKNPGGSKIEVRLESASPKGQGFLNNVDRLRVSRT
jgi:hypothetical protein